MAPVYGRPAPVELGYRRAPWAALCATSTEPGESLNYFIHPYAEVDGVAVEQVPARFQFRRLPGPTASR